MTTNVGKTDRVVRFILALVFAYFGLTVNALFYILTVALLVSSILGYCPSYQWMKINTAKKSN